MNNNVYVLLSREKFLVSKMNTISNNVANINTTGYKKEEIIFENYLSSIKSSEEGNVNHPSSFVNFHQGKLKHTGNRLDLAIQGEGFFKVQTPEGFRYTRDGSFTINHLNQIVSHNGYPVLSVNDAIILVPPKVKDIKLTVKGEILADGNKINALGIVNFEDLQLLKKIGYNLLETEQEALPTKKYKLQQGFLESSNVESVEEIGKLVEVKNFKTRVNNNINDSYALSKSLMKALSKTE